MPFIDMGHEFGDTKEPVLAPSGKKYDLRCKDIEELDKDGKRSIRVQILIEEPGQEYAPFSHFLSLPNPVLDQKSDEDKGNKPGTSSNFKRLQIKRFLTAFRIPFTGTGFDPQDIPGATARLELTQEMYEGRNNQRLVLPPLPGEEGSDSKAGGGPAKKKSSK